MTMPNCIFLLISVLTALDLSAGQALQEGFWESFAPGELLRLLDQDTSPRPQAYSYAAQRRSDGTEMLAAWPNAPEDSLPATTKSVRKRTAPSSDEINYDEAYEAFVRKYFNDKLEEDVDDSSEHDTYTQDGNDPGDSDDSSGDREPLTEETKTRTQRKPKEKCRRVRKNKQNCMICENARNGEKSESCSFSRQSEPQSYAFEKEKSYKKQRDTDEPTAESDEQTSSEETDAAETAASFEVFSKRNTSPKDSSTCIQMMGKGKVCYQCVDGEGTTTKCYTPKDANRRAASLPNNSKARPAKGKEHKVQKTQQRIYKRTISYSFEKGTNGTATNEKPLDDDDEVVDTTTAEVKNSDSPHLKEEMVFKLVKQNETLVD